MKITPPKNISELLKKAKQLSGLKLGELSYLLKKKIPLKLKSNKGFIGTLIEYYLGGENKNTKNIDFPSLGIELKTIPINNLNKVLENTFICMANLIYNDKIKWENSYVNYKLKKILFIPIEGVSSIPISLRIIGQPILWSPNYKENICLKQDWENIKKYISLGKKEKKNSLNNFLILKTKAANSTIKTKYINKIGECNLITPKGYYLNKKFTNLIIEKFINKNI